MNHSTDILTLKGVSYALVPLKAYEALLVRSEEIDDIAAFDRAVAKNSEAFPDALARQMLEGANRVKLFREYRKLTQQQLADKAGITRAYLAAVETGRKNGSVKMLKSIAKTLRVDLDLIC